jgi:hypothetical protein
VFAERDALGWPVGCLAAGAASLGLPMNAHFKSLDLGAVG